MERSEGPGERRGGPVGRVADDRVPEGGELAPDLVRDAREDGHFQQGGVAPDFERPVEGFREHRPFLSGQGASRDAPHAAAERRRVGEQARDPAGAVEAPDDFRQVDLAGGVRRELGADGVEGLPRTGGENEARRAGVDAVEQPRHQRVVADAGHVGIASEQGGGERPRFPDGDGVAGLPGRLVGRNESGAPCGPMLPQGRTRRSASRPPAGPTWRRGGRRPSRRGGRSTPPPARASTPARARARPCRAAPAPRPRYRR